jgi:hypothetical protein
MLYNAAQSMRQYEQDDARRVESCCAVLWLCSDRVVQRVQLDITANASSKRHKCNLHGRRRPNALQFAFDAAYLVQPIFCALYACAACAG